MLVKAILSLLNVGVFRESSFEARISSIDFRVLRHWNNFKNQFNKGFETTIYFSNTQQ